MARPVRAAEASKPPRGLAFSNLASALSVAEKTRPAPVGTWHLVSGVRDRICTRPNWSEMRAVWAAASMPDELRSPVRHHLVLHRMDLEQGGAAALQPAHRAGPVRDHPACAELGEDRHERARVGRDPRQRGGGGRGPRSHCADETPAGLSGSVRLFLSLLTWQNKAPAGALRRTYTYSLT